MSDQKTSGLILRVRLLTETSLIVHWLTPDFGRMATVAKGARGPKSAFRGKLDLFFLAEFSFRQSQRSELHNLREVILRDTHDALRKDIGFLQQASYCAALIEQATETETPLPEIFKLFAEFLKQLGSQPPQPITIFAFETKLLRELGLEPDFAESKLSEGAKQILQRLGEMDWPMLLRLKLSEPQVAEIRNFLHGFLVFHLGKIPKGRCC